MATARVSYQNIAVKYGIFVGVAHILYFLIMGLLDLLENVGLSFVSSLFLIIGIVVAISKYKSVNRTIGYFSGLGIGATVGVVSSSLLAVFLMIYLNLFNETYINNLQASVLFPESITGLSLFILTIIYGTWPGFLIAFIAMQWFKRPDHSMPERI